MPFSFFSDYDPCSEMNEKFFYSLFEETIYRDTSYLTRFFALEQELQEVLHIEKLGLQDSGKFKTQRRSLKIAQSLIDADGEWDMEQLKFLVEEFHTRGYISLISSANDSVFTDFFKNTLKQFLDQKKIRSLLSRFQAPLGNQACEHLIRDCLQLNLSHVLTSRDIRVAVLSACLYPLRQNVGSCFATAPAILIQSEQIENFLNDLMDILSKGKLLRVFSGKEHSVPMSPSPGVGELRKNISHIPLEYMLSYSLSFFYPSQQAGLLDDQSSIKEKRDAIFKAFSQFLISKGPFTAEQFFLFFSLSYFGIDQQELDQYLIHEKQVINRSLKLGVYYHASYSKKQINCLSAYSAFEKAKKSFLSMTENLLARTWEYTIASFSESKMEFSKWNLFQSIGMQPEDQHGIGPIVFTYVENKITQCNQKLEHLHEDYQIAFNQLRATETLLQQASNESDIRRLKAEFQSRGYHMQACLENRDRFYKKSSFYPQFFSFFMQKMSDQFTEYFQEIYDAEMREVEVREYEDSPAGFRLVFKHGRKDASVWSLIHDSSGFIQSLLDFLILVEPQLVAEAKPHSCEEDVKEILVMISHHFRTQSFLDSAFQRALASGKRGHDTHRTPWSYVSGGAMAELLKTYYRTEKDISEEVFSAQSPLDLFTLLLETMKGIPYNFSAFFPFDHQKNVLMHSPTHAFSLLPYENIFFQGWDNNQFTYTWIRDQYVQPAKGFYHQLTLSEDEWEFLIERFCAALPTKLAAQVRQNVRIDANLGWKETGLQIAKALDGPSVLSDAFDSFLMANLPLSDKNNWKDRILLLFEEKDFEIFLSQLPEIPVKYLSGRDLLELAERLYCCYKGTVCFDIDIKKYLYQQAEKHQLATPSPCIFADTNWSQNYFAFVLSPLFGELQLWRVAKVGRDGINMRSWDQVFHGKESGNFSIYIKPQEYQSVFERNI
ncbi:MAG: hypothetical protein EBZ47_04615 [Chlamydiae bacterium]|nr:hypothetical protein [Chlamydiota bacterium]